MGGRLLPWFRALLDLPYECRRHHRLCARPFDSNYALTMWTTSNECALLLQAFSDITDSASTLASWGEAEIHATIELQSFLGKVREGGLAGWEGGRAVLL